jgi:hypothetical protein
LAQASDLLRKEQLALCNSRNQLAYDKDDSEAGKMKTAIIDYKKSVNDAKHALEEDVEQHLLVQPNHCCSVPIA